MSETHSHPPPAVDPALGHMDALPAGTMLGEFELQGLLGVGGFGMVYKAYDHSLQRAVAIKEYMPAALVGRVAGLQVSVRSTLDDQPFRAGLTSFISEARLLARFDHPSLVKVYRFWEANNTAYMVMPLYQGMTLKQARSLMSAPPPEDWLRTILWSVTQALKVLHDNGTIHRDVSPDNIFLQDLGPPVLLDLGAARRAVLERGHKHTAILKVNYAPIEQYADATDLQEGPWTDLYALGAVMHGCVCNEAPLPATSRAVRDNMPPFARIAQTALTHFGTKYSTAFVDALAHTLVLEPTDRTQSVLDFCEEMQLQVTVEWSRFDWRLALGKSVSLALPAAPLGLGHADMTRVEQTKTQIYIADTQILHPDAPTRTHSATGGARATTTNAPAEPVVAASRRLLWWGLTFLLASVVVLVVLLWPSPAAPPPPPPLISPQLPVKALVQEPPTAPTQPSPIATTVKPITSGLTTLPSSTPPKAKAAEAKPEARFEVRPEAAVTSNAPKPPNTSAPPAAPNKTEEMCAETNILSRSLCVYRNCQKPENAKLAACIEDRKKWESQNSSP